MLQTEARKERDVRLNWNTRALPQGAIVLTTLDTHTAGEPLRILIDGLPELPGETLLAKRAYFARTYDHLRRMLMWEPRGHHEMYGCVLTPPSTAEADLGVFFLHNEGYSTMCGHGVIGLVTALLETGALEPKGPQTPVTLETPAGLVYATAHLTADGLVERVSFLNVPSFLYARDLTIELPEIGEITLDVAFGGAFYAILPAERVGLRVVPDMVTQLAAAGEAIKKAVNTRLKITHPTEEALSFLYGTIFTDSPEDPTHHSRNVCIFANAEVDRSPTGTGVSARLAALDARREITDGERITIESILGAQSTFQGRVAERTTFGTYQAVVPEVSGSAFVTGRHEFRLDPRDTLGRGFLF